MNTENPAMLDQKIESTLARLPEWQPPPDFTKRLAAAAARQSATPRPVHIAAPAWSAALPMALWSTGIAAVLAWAVPWSQLSSLGLVWTCVAAMSAAGAFLTFRVLRTP